MKGIEDNHRDLWDNIKHTSIQIIWVPEEEEKKKGTEKVFEEIIVENIPNMGKEIVNQVQEAQRVQYRINPRRNMPRHILINQKLNTGTSLVAQQLGIRLPMQETWVHALVGEDPTCRGVARPVSHNH